MSLGPAPAQGLRLQISPWENGLLVRCNGRLTAEHTDSLKSRVRGLIPTTKGIILDLREVTRLDSAGLGALVGLYISARKANCQFLLANYNQSVKDLLGLTNLLSVFEDCARSGVRIP
ncbi:MAG TPA: STAS domain-containing protein [Candidatus Acidoferrum sp.]|nr:STAS domain-containing protein [Candidatus Acidoferrum sp.]